MKIITTKGTKNTKEYSRVFQCNPVNASSMITILGNKIKLAHSNNKATGFIHALAKKLKSSCSLWPLWFSLLFSFSAVAEPKRIIALAPHIVESLYEIGAGDKIVATVQFADYPQQALEIPRIGGYHGLQMETILELKPDLIIAWKNGNRKEDIEKLKKLGLPIAYSETGKLDDVPNSLLHLGKLTGRQEQAKIVAEQFSLKLKKIRAKYQTKRSLSGYYELWPEPMRTINKNTLISELMMTCGISNVFADATTDYPQISIENVVVKKPEVIILPDERANKPQPKTDWTPWQFIPAVANNAFIKVNADHTHRFSSRLLLGVETMCEQADKYRISN